MRYHGKIKLQPAKDTRGVDRVSDADFRGENFPRVKGQSGVARVKLLFEVGKVIRPKSKQSRGNPKPISKELHSETVHVATLEAKQPTLPHVRMPKLSEDLENLELGKRSILE